MELIIITYANNKKCCFNQNFIECKIVVNGNFFLLFLIIHNILIYLNVSLSFQLIKVSKILLAITVNRIWAKSFFQ